MSYLRSARDLFVAAKKYSLKLEHPAGRAPIRERKAAAAWRGLVQRPQVKDAVRALLDDPVSVRRLWVQHDPLFKKLSAELVIQSNGYGANFSSGMYQWCPLDKSRLYSLTRT